MARSDRRANPGETDLHRWLLPVAGVPTAVALSLSLVVGFGDRGIEVPAPARAAPPPPLAGAGATVAAPSHHEEEEDAPTF